MVSAGNRITPSNRLAVGSSAPQPFAEALQCLLEALVCVVLLDDIVVVLTTLLARSRDEGLSLVDVGRAYAHICRHFFTRMIAGYNPPEASYF
jgi:hypothetical protein